MKDPFIPFIVGLLVGAFSMALLIQALTPRPPVAFDPDFTIQVAALMTDNRCVVEWDPAERTINVNGFGVGEPRMKRPNFVYVGRVPEKCPTCGHMLKE